MKRETASVATAGEARRRRRVRSAKRVPTQKAKLRVKRAWMEGRPRIAKRVALT